MRETICVKTICGVINKNSEYSQTGHIECIGHDRHAHKSSKCRMNSTIMTRNGEISSAWWTREGISVQFSSVIQSCLTLCNPVNQSTPGLPVHHQPPESTQIHVHWDGDAIQPSHPSPPAFNHSQHQSLFQWVQWVSSLHQVAKVLALGLQHQSSQWIFRIDFL